MKETMDYLKITPEMDKRLTEITKRVSEEDFTYILNLGSEIYHQITKKQVRFWITGLVFTISLNFSIALSEIFR